MQKPLLMDESQCGFPDSLELWQAGKLENTKGNSG
jgi:hypothetical protein